MLVYRTQRTFMREQPFGKPKLSIIHRWLSYKGQGGVESLLSVSFINKLLTRENLAVYLTCFIGISMVSWVCAYTIGYVLIGQLTPC